MEDRFLAIVNPAAGGGRCRKLFPAALERLERAGLRVDVKTTRRPGEASELARAAYERGVRRFIAGGGDGTSFEIVNGLFPAATDAERPSLGFLPLGTGNSFLRDFSNDGAEHALETLMRGAPRSCDVLRLRHRDGVLHYINLLSIGFVADVNGLRARRFNRWGELGYVAAVVSEVARLRAQPFPMRVDDGAWDRDPLVFASFNNSRFTGGRMMMAPQADTADGLIDLIRVAPLGRLDLLATFPKIFQGTHVLNPAVSSAKVTTIEFEIAQEIDVMVDGEALRVVPEKLEVLPGALEVYA